MHPEKYSLTWQAYSDHLKAMMKELMMNEDFSDVTLVTEDKKQIKANRNILHACSPVFRDILKKENNSNTVMYLRGIQFSEMESIMQFIYLGEATFYEERMDEFLAVAKSLEIKDLCNTRTNDEPEPKPSPGYPETTTGLVKEQTIISNQIKKQAQQDGFATKNKYDCGQCHKTYSSLGALHNHKQSVHQGVKYSCNQCEYQASQTSDVKKHIQAKHEGVKYQCDQCNYQSAYQSELTKHTRAKHEGVNYAYGAKQKMAQPIEVEW